MSGREMSSIPQQFQVDFLFLLGTIIGATIVLAAVAIFLFVIKALQK